MIRPVVLVILDGWGIAPSTRGNAIQLAQKPFFDSLVSTYPTVLLQASGPGVGLPWGEMGNSEVGHLNIGAGKIMYQDLPRISMAIADGTFATNAAFLKAIAFAKEHNSTLHLAGLVSNGGIHGQTEHLYALLELCHAQGLTKIAIHAFLDGRDTPYNSGKRFLVELQDVCRETGVGCIASVMGRYWAMDRDRHWERTEAAYRCMVDGVGMRTTQDLLQSLDASYADGVFDEQLQPTVMQDTGKPVATVQPHDAIIFFNFRSDRMRQITEAFTEEAFSGFARGAAVADLCVVTMTEYEPHLPVTVAFPPDYVALPLAKVISEAGLQQLHVAETEKYAHVTFFLNGGREEPFTGEQRALVPSPRVASYDEQPAMNAHGVTEKILRGLEDEIPFIVANYANVDMVGHTGNIPAMIAAVGAVDNALSTVVAATLERHGCVVITADHGNAEDAMKLQTGTIDKEHSTNPVPCIVVAKAYAGRSTVAGKDLSTITPIGVLSDVAPTVLDILGVAVPSDMTGHSLLPYL